MSELTSDERAELVAHLTGMWPATEQTYIVGTVDALAPVVARIANRRELAAVVRVSAPPDDPDRIARRYVATLRGMHPSRRLAAVLDEIEAGLSPDPNPSQHAPAPSPGGRAGTT